MARAADAIDADPADTTGEARWRSDIVRHVVEQGCRDIVERSARAAGPAPLAFDAAHAQRIADVWLYIRQQHAERDLEAIGRAHVPGGRGPDAAPPNSLH